MAEEKSERSSVVRDFFDVKKGPAGDEESSDADFVIRRDSSAGDDCAGAKAIDATPEDELVSAVKANDYDTVDRILLSLFETGLNVNAQSSTGWSAVHYASTGRKDAILRLLIDSRGDLNLQTNEGRTPLHVACSFEAEETAKVLIEQGSSMQLKDRRGLTPGDLAGKSDKKLQKRLETYAKRMK